MSVVEGAIGQAPFAIDRVEMDGGGTGFVQHGKGALLCGFVRCCCPQHQTAGGNLFSHPFGMVTRHGEREQRTEPTGGSTAQGIPVWLSRRAASSSRAFARLSRVSQIHEIPNNVIAIDAFAQLFDGFSIGSNDLTQLTLGVDRDSEIIAFDFDERDPGMLEMARLAVIGAKRNHRHVGICGEAPANYPEIAQFLAGLRIDSISVTAASLLRTMTVVREAERASANHPVAAL